MNIFMNTYGWVLIFDIAWILSAVLFVYYTFRITNRGMVRDAVVKMSRLRIVKISFYIVVLYFSAGFLDQIRIPGTGNIDDPSLIDLMFHNVKQERTYSAPLSSHITTAPENRLDEPENRVEGFHILGTNINGYDVFYQVVKGSSTALKLAFGAVIISFPIGVFLGILAGFYGGFLDDMIQWFYTTVASIPWLLFVIAFLMVFGRELIWIILAFGLTNWVGLARLIRGETLKIKSLDYITAAKASGIPDSRILYKHILPNLHYLIVITFTLSASHVILAESVLTFIGIGVRPGTASWGVMLMESQSELSRTPVIWWVFVGSSFFGILPLVLGLNILGDSLRDALDPRLKGKS